MSPGPKHQLWQVGDRVRFAHQHPDGEVRVVKALHDSAGDPMIEIEGMSGWFAADIFIAADYPEDSVVPRKAVN